VSHKGTLTWNQASAGKYDNATWQMGLRKWPTRNTANTRVGGHDKNCTTSLLNRNCKCSNSGYGCYCSGKTLVTHATKLNRWCSSGTNAAGQPSVVRIMIQWPKLARSYVDYSVQFDAREAIILRERLANSEWSESTAQVQNRLLLITTTEVFCRENAIILPAEHQNYTTNNN
jgi:hypothetical protein